MLYDKYKNEAEFRDLFIRPLLTKLGYLRIAELDGSQEFGKDFVFSEITPFGFMRHHAVVAKHEKKLNQPSSKLVQTVLDQIKQAFSVSFSVLESPDKSRISSVFVMNSGKISPNAEKWLRAELSFKKYGQNVHFFSSERLAQLDAKSAFVDQSTIRPKLIGLINTINLNLIVWGSIKKHLPDFPEGRGIFTQAFEDFLSQPFLADYIKQDQISLLLQECRIINTINTRRLMGIKHKNGDEDINSIKNVIESAEKRASEIKIDISSCLTNFSLISENMQVKQSMGTAVLSG